MTAIGQRTRIATRTVTETTSGAIAAAEAAAVIVTGVAAETETEIAASTATATATAIGNAAGLETEILQTEIGTAIRTAGETRTGPALRTNTVSGIETGPERAAGTKTETARGTGAGTVGLAATAAPTRDGTGTGTETGESGTAGGTRAVVIGEAAAHARKWARRPHRQL